MSIVGCSQEESHSASKYFLYCKVWCRVSFCCWACTGTHLTSIHRGNQIHVQVPLSSNGLVTHHNGGGAFICINKTYLRKKCNAVRFIVEINW